MLQSGLRLNANNQNMDLNVTAIINANSPHKTCVRFQSKYGFDPTTYWFRNEFMCFFFTRIASLIEIEIKDIALSSVIWILGFRLMVRHPVYQFIRIIFILINFVAIRQTKLRIFIYLKHEFDSVLRRSDQRFIYRNRVAISKYFHRIPIFYHNWNVNFIFINWFWLFMFR